MVRIRPGVRHVTLKVQVEVRSLGENDGVYLFVFW